MIDTRAGLASAMRSLHIRCVRTLKTGLLTWICLLPSFAAFGGNGTFDASNGTFDFSVSIRFAASPTQLSELKNVFEDASRVLLTMTHGQHQFGEITAFNNGLASRNADFWILDGKGSSFATPGKYGCPGRTIVLHRKSLLGVDGARILAHAFMHHAYGLHDEHTSASGTTAKCIADPLSGFVCMMENYKTLSNQVGYVDALCLPSNHDADNDSIQEYVHHESCWETMKKRYAGLTIPSQSQFASTVTPTKFLWKNGSGKRRILVVLDRSGSMSGNPFTQAQNAAKVFVDLTRVGDELGVASFSSVASKDYKIDEMTLQTKEDAKNKIAGLGSGGATSIGGGLEAAYEMLTGETNQNRAHAVILLSDGHHNSGISPYAVIPLLVAKGIPVYTIALSDGADTALMQTIAVQTKGKYYAATDASTLTSIYAQISSELNDGGIVAFGSNFVESNLIKQEKIFVDAKTDVAKVVVSWDKVDAKLILIFKSPGGITVTVNTETKQSNPPDGITVDLQSSAVLFEVSEKISKYGTWNILIANKETDAAVLAVNYQYQVLSDDSDILFSTTPDKLAYTYPEVMTIDATVLYDWPLTNVSMTGTVKRPNGSLVPISLDDTGSLTSGDLFASDGSASYRFSGWNAPGVYIVSMDVQGDGSAKEVVGEALDGKTPAIDIQTFHRHTEFAVSVSGVPTIDSSLYFVDKLKTHFEPSGPLLNRATLAGSLDLDLGLVDAEKQPLAISIGTFYQVIPQLTKIDDTRFVFSQQIDFPKYSGFVDLFVKGSSKGAHEFKVDGCPLANPTAGTPVTVQFEWGDFDESAVIVPSVKVDEDGAKDSTYKASKQPAQTKSFYVTSALVKLKAAANKDKLSLRLRHNFAFDAKTGTTTIRLGSFQVSIAGSLWVLVPGAPNQLQYTASDLATGKSLTIIVDSELREVSVSGSGLELPEFPNPAIVEFQGPGFSLKNEITLSVGKTSLSY